jgi:hypothetical protein
VEELFSDLAAEFGQMGGEQPLIGVLNCHDWPLICEKQMIRKYPTIRLLHKGQLRNYNGPIEKDALRRGVKL